MGENCMDIEAVPCKVPKMDWKLKSEDDETNKFLEFLQAEPLSDKSPIIHKAYQKEGLTTNKFLEFLQAEPLSDKSPIIDKAYQKEGLTRKLVKKWIEEG